MDKANHIVSLESWGKEDIFALLDKAMKVKRNPGNYSESLKGKTLLMMFEKPSLRTRVSFEVAMTQLGGHAIYLDLITSPVKSKESLKDSAIVSSRYCDIIMARMFDHEDIEELAKFATVPVINALTNKYHPCQILSDLLTLKEKKKSFPNLKLAFVGDGNNNITHSLLLGCSAIGMDISVGCPGELSPLNEVVNLAKKKAKVAGSNIEIVNDAVKAVRDADVVYADSWMSYHISPEQKMQRFKLLKPFQVTSELMGYAKPDAVFMNCLPAKRGEEQTADVIDGPHSIVYDQAENRLHMQKALLLVLNSKL